VLGGLPSPQFLESKLEHRGIRYHTSATVSKITASSVQLADGKVFESRYSMVIPPLAAVPAIARSQGLANPKGFIPTDGTFRHKKFDNVYASWPHKWSMQ
jgi:NADPH-dependent 2,4-dienoyl-CoA reductase/sulfur reductase-like enzyme